MKLVIIWFGLLIISWLTSIFFTIINSFTFYESTGLTMVIFFSLLLYIINKFEII